MCFHNNLYLDVTILFFSGSIDFNSPSFSHSTDAKGLLEKGFIPDNGQLKVNQSISDADLSVNLHFIPYITHQSASNQ